MTTIGCGRPRSRLGCAASAFLHARCNTVQELRTLAIGQRGKSAARLAVSSCAGCGKCDAEPLRAWHVHCARIALERLNAVLSGALVQDSITAGCLRFRPY